MTLDDTATLVPATGHYFYAPTPGQARPSNQLVPGSPWVDLGHTSLDSPFGITSDGGDSTTLGTWQNSSLRVSYAPRVESIAFELKQWDTATLRLYYGSNAAVSSSGNLRTPANAAPTLGALYVIVTDGAEQVAMYWPSVSIFRGDDISFDAEALAGLPVVATILGTSGQDWLYEITPKDNLGATSIAVAPTSSSKAAAQTTQLTVTATYPDSTTADVTALATYASSNTAKATVSASGLVTFVATGSATVTCTYQGRTATCAITVT